MADLLSPMTQEDFARERRSALRKLAMCFVVALAAYGMESWAAGWRVVVLVALLGTGFCWMAVWSDSLRLGKPLEGEDCTRLRDLATEYPEIATMVAQVREMGRPVAWGDLWQADGWLYQQAKDAEERACRELNGIETS